MAGKPDKTQIKQLIANAKAAEQWLHAAVQPATKEIAEVRRAADAFFAQRFQAALEAMPVDLLAQGKQGIRVAYLKEAGIETVYQLSKLTQKAITDLDGIGVQGAAKICALTKEIVENTRKKLSVRIQVDEPTQQDDDLVRALHLLCVHESLRPALDALYREQYRALRQGIDAASRVGAGLSWTFTSKSKKEATLQQCDALQAQLEGPLGMSSALYAYTEAVQADITACRAYFREQSAACYALLETHCKHLDTSDQPETGLSADLLAAIEACPVDLQYMKATLRSYQLFGVKYAVHQKRTLLGDEMGLGKTIQAIAVMAALKAAGKHHFLVVCPASVLVNWVREIQKHSTLGVTKVHGADEASLYQWRCNGDVAVTTYESISRFALPEKFTFDMLVVDEAHYVKNPEAQRTVAMQKLLSKTEGVLYMSGTPLVNRVEEMCFLVQCLQPAVAAQLEKVKNLSTAEQFRKELAPVYLRRVREDVLKELPELIEKEQWCALGSTERSAYRAAVESGNFMAIRQVSWNVDDLRQSSKAMRLCEICEDAKEQDRKVIVFSFFRQTLEKVHALLGDRCSETISGDISPAHRQEIVDRFNAAEPGAVLVSQVQAGGTGLNIQSASVVVFCEPQLTPAIESQAVARAYRMGQTRDVLVYRLLADDTADERILEILSGKQQAFDSFADESLLGDVQLETEAAASGSWVARMIEEEKARIADATI